MPTFTELKDDTLEVACSLVNHQHDIATHLMEDVQFEEYRFADLNNGRLVLTDAIDQLSFEDCTTLHADLLSLARGDD